MALGLLVGAGLSLLGAKSQSDSAKSATNAAVAGEQARLDFDKESRDLARADSAPYREAGTTALSALMDMTGLSGMGSSLPSTGPVSPPNPYGVGPNGEQGGPGRQFNYDGAYSSANPNAVGRPDTAPLGRAGAYAEMLRVNPEMAARFKNNFVSRDGQAAWDAIYGEYGDPAAASRYVDAYSQQVVGRALGGTIYNINELGPEDVYQNGAMTRSSDPRSIPPNPTGYVHPNVQGRAIGGSIGGGDPARFVPYPTQRIPSTPQPAVGPQPPTGHVNPVVTANADPRTSGIKLGGALPPLQNAQIMTSGMDPRQSGGPPQPGPTGSPNGVYDGYDGQGGLAPENDGGREGGYSFQADPGYNFRVDEGVRAVDRSASARGQSLSGGQLKALTRYGQDYASAEYGNVYNRISNIAGLGQVSTDRNNALNQAYSANMGNAAANQGMSSAYGQMAQGNAWAGAANQIAQLPWDQWQNPFASSSNPGINPNAAGP